MLAEGVISKELTSAAKRAIAENPDKLQTGSRNPFGMRPELTNLINESKFTPVLNSLIGAFDPPITTHVGILPVATTPPSEKDMPYFNAGVHMDGLTTTGFINDKAPDAAMSTDEYSAAYAEMINANADVRSEASLHRPGRHDHNIGTNGGMLFQGECRHGASLLVIYLIRGLHRPGVLALHGLLHPLRGRVPHRPARAGTGAVLRAPRLPPRDGVLLRDAAVSRRHRRP